MSYQPAALTFGNVCARSNKKNSGFFASLQALVLAPKTAPAPHARFLDKTVSLRQQVFGFWFLVFLSVHCMRFVFMLLKSE